MQGLVVERLGPRDVERARRHVACFWRDGGPAVASFLASRLNVFVAAEVDGRPVGQALGYLLPRWDGEPPMLFLYAIDVDEAHRRAGVGRALVQEFRRVGLLAGSRGAFVLTQEGNEAAMALYRATGGVRPHEDDVVFEYPEG